MDLDWGEPAPAEGRDVREEGLAALAAAFSGPNGRLALDALRAMTVERVLGPDQSDAMLRFAEGQRALVKAIEAIVRQRTGG